MAGLEEQLNAVLSNPQMMQQIMAMAQNFAPPAEATLPQSPQIQPTPPPQPAGNFPAIDPGMLQKLSGLMSQQGGVDKNAQFLLKALSPYISGHRITKLEKAMQAAKMAQLATSLFGNKGLGR
jgi:hypothetical protein